MPPASTLACCRHAWASYSLPLPQACSHASALRLLLQVTLPSGQVLKLVDTAGIRKRAKVADTKDGPEQISVDRAIRAFRRADIGVLVIDGSEGGSLALQQGWCCDKHLQSLSWRVRKRGLV
jgi:hypothetical protein